MAEDDFLLVYDRYQNRLKMGKKLYKSSQQLYTALRSLKEIEERRAKEFKVIGTFLKEFYNESSEYKDLSKKLSETVELQSKNSLQQVS